MAIDSPYFILTLIKFNSVGSFAPPIPLSPSLLNAFPFPFNSYTPGKILGIADACR